jgi:hypothetical protein
MLAGARGFVRRFPALGWSLAAAALLALLIHARWQNWAGGWCWGPRHIFMVHALLAPFAAALAFDWSRARAALVAAVLIPAFAVQLYGASQSFIDFYILYYRTPERGPNAYVMFSGEDAAPAQVIAPINDSVYVPQNSQWQRYAEMWRLGYTDNLWLRLAKRAAGAEQEVR